LAAGAAVPVAVAGERPEMENAEEAQGVASGGAPTGGEGKEEGAGAAAQPEGEANAERGFAYPLDWRKQLAEQGFFCGHLEDPIPVADLVKEFHTGYVEKDVKYNFMNFKKDGLQVNTVKDEKRLIGNIVEDSQLGKRVEAIGEDLLKHLEGEGGGGIKRGSSNYEKGTWPRRS